ncbi:MAG: AAA family ATPase [Pseudomonadota bacterium]
MSALDLRAIARHYGGTVSGGQALIPAIGHSKADRGVAIKPESGAPDGCLVHVFNGGDPLAEKDRLRADGFLPKFEPKPKADIGRYKPVATFEYANADGELIYRTVRLQPAYWTGPGKSPKEFRAERFEGGRWVAGIKGLDRVPYRLPELAQAIDAGETVYLTEGEAKADKLCNWGFAATAIAFGSKGWSDEYAQHFSGARVVILPDNDTPGRDFARKVHADLKEVASPCVVELPGLPEAGDVIDWKGDANELEALSSQATEPGWLTNKQESRRAGFEFVAVGDLKYRPPEFLIDGMIETDSLGLFFGDPGCGKSFLAVDLALSVASGTAFHGRNVKSGPVFYIAGEGHNGLARRFEAWSRRRGVALQGVPLFKSTRAAQLLDGESAKAVSEAVHELAEQHGAPALIEIDTLARNFGPGDENSTAEMGKFIAAVDDLKAQFPGCTIAIVHHSGHADKQRARGAMALKGALDFEYRMEKNEATIRLTNTKMKDAEPPAPIAFTLEGVQLDDGASSAALIETDVPASCTRLKGKAQVAMTALTDALARHGRTGMGSDYPKGVKVVSIEHWRAACTAHELTTGSSDSAARTAFMRAKERLIERDLVRGFNNHFWKVRADD